MCHGSIITMESPTNTPFKDAGEGLTKGLSDDIVEERIRDVDPKEERAFVSTFNAIQMRHY